MFSEFISQNIIWVGAFMLATNLWLWSLIQGRVPGVGMVSAIELPSLQRGKKSTIIDVNSADEFAKSHIPESKNFPLSLISDTNKDLLKLKSHTTILVCQSGGKSSKAAKSLQKLGFEDLHILRGGLMSWAKENLPLSSSKS